MQKKANRLANHYDSKTKNWEKNLRMQNKAKKYLNNLWGNQRQNLTLTGDMYDIIDLASPSKPHRVLSFSFHFKNALYTFCALNYIPVYYIAAINYFHEHCMQ